MNKFFIMIITTLVLFTSTGCVTDMVKSLNHGINGFVLNTDKNSAIVFAGTTAHDSKREGRGSFIISGRGVIFLLDVNTKKELSLPINFQADETPVFSNLNTGTYRFLRWEYDSCKRMNKDKYNKIHCSEWHLLKGTSNPIKDNIFEVKKGETLYLGHFVLDSKNQTLTLINKEQSDTQKLKNIVDIKDRKIKNISNKFNIKDWKFNATSKAGLFEL